jgi:hypothetical protein
MASTRFPGLPGGGSSGMVHLAPARIRGPASAIEADAEGSPMHVRMARMTFSGDAHELAKRAESGLLPILEEQAGFQAYSVASTGDEIWSLSVWDSAESAEAANSVAAGWVAENMSGEVDIIETKIGELLISTTLGVTA